MTAGNVVSVGALLPRDLLDRVGSGDVTLAGLDPTEYGLVPGERVRDAVTRSWNRLVGVWGAFRRAETMLPETNRTATSLTRDRWFRPLLEELGFFGLPLVRSLAVDGKDYAVSHQWGTTVPIHLLGCRVPVDRRTPGVQGAARVSPHGLVQEFLNRSDEHLWGIVSNGLLLRVLRDNASLTRAAYCEFDLAGIFDGEVYSDFVLLWLICHRTRFEGDPPEKCLLEQWSTEAAAAGTRALDRLREGVEKAIISLGEGFLAHRDNSALRAGLNLGSLTDGDYLRQLLRLVYRLIFLLVAESRDLLLAPGTDETVRLRYQEFYSVGRLRKLAAARRGTSHDDLWQSLRVTMSALDADHRGIPVLGLRPLGSFLWSPDSIPDLVDDSIENRHLLAAMRRLSLVRDVEAKAVRQVDYRNLGTRELGSVYESLLELHPEVNVDARTFKLVGAAGAERKLTGSYYTPESLISRLLDEALDPILDEAERAPDPEQALLGLRVLDPACGSGHFLISAAHRIAGRLASVRVGGVEPTPAELRTALRDVVGRCLYGIDINPMAVELCKVSLWLEANDNRRPLGFLDHHIVCGNSLLGTTPDLLEKGVPNEAFKALTGDDKKWLTQLRKTNRNERKRRDQQILELGWSPSDDIATLAEEVAIIDAEAEDTASNVAAKADRYSEFQQSGTYVRSKLVAAAWCAAFVAPKKTGTPAITDATVQAIGQGYDTPPGVGEMVEDLAKQYRFLHLHIAFPDVFEESDGFDALLGNPPWDQIQYDPRETFAVSHPDIAAARTMAIRNRLIAALADDEPETYARYLRDVHHLGRIKHFLHASQRYPLGSVGRLNTAPLFVELMWRGINSKGGVGVIVPTGIATDSFTQRFFNAMIDRKALVSLYDFENRKKVFPGIDGRLKFCMLTLSGAGRPVPQAEFAFFLHRVEQLAEPERRYSLSQDDFALFNPNTRTCPTFRTRDDMEIAAKMYRRAGVLWKEERDRQPGENSWRVSFQLMFMMNTDSGLFRTRDEMEEDGWELHGNIFAKDDETYLPLYEAKLFHQYDHRFATFDGVSTRDLKNGNARPMTPEEKKDPSSVILPRYWVPESEVNRRTRQPATSNQQPATSNQQPATSNQQVYYRGSGQTGTPFALRKITNATNERTGIFTVIPFVGLSDSGTLLLVGTMSSEISRDRPTIVHPSSRSFWESR